MSVRGQSFTLQVFITYILTRNSYDYVIIRTMKKIVNTYALPNASSAMSADEIRAALSDFEYFMSNYAQIVGKDRKLHPFKLNAFQKMLFRELLPLIKKDTRLDKRLTVCVLKPRQVGCTVGIIAFINYICAFLDDFQNTSICHVLPVADTISKLYNKKIDPIISGVHPSIYPEMYRENLSSSIVTKYDNIKGIRRQNYYEIVSSGASSVRSDTINITIFDEVAFYKKPEVVADAVLGSMPDYGFSLVVYMSTFDTRSNTYFLDKIKTAASGADDWKLLFCPWFMIYPEQPQGINYHDLELTEYDNKVIIPAMIEYGVSETKWGDAIDWYHRKSRVISSMLKEYPTTVEEVIQFSEDKTVFNKESLERQKENIIAGKPMRTLTDNQTGKVEMKETDDSPFRVFQYPLYGHKYRIVIDPITARSAETDFFAMHVIDLSTHNQAAVFRGRGYTDEDYADWAVSIGKIYNNAELLPEINVANGFVVAVNARRYYHWYYSDKKNRADRIPGLRTTVSTKEVYIDKLNAMLDRGSLKIHDEETLDELYNFIRFSKGGTMKMAAKRGHHDDLVMALAMYAGSLSIQELDRGRRTGFAIL